VGIVERLFCERRIIDQNIFYLANAQNIFYLAKVCLVHTTKRGLVR
jgi:hypothetical protein